MASHCSVPVSRAEKAEIRSKVIVRAQAKLITEAELESPEQVLDYSMAYSRSFVSYSFHF